MARVYVSGAMRGGQELIETYREMINILKANGHTVTSEFILTPLEDEKKKAKKAPGLTDNDIFRRDLLAVKQSNVILAEVTIPSHGVGYEIAYARAFFKPVIAMFIMGTDVSAMIVGDGKITQIPYTDVNVAVNEAMRIIGNMRLG